jgi:electron transfer flavoprotein alpha subunit
MSKDIWVVVEHWKGEVHPVTRELIARARELAANTGGGVTALVLAEDAEAVAGKLAGLGLDGAIGVASPELRRYRARPYVEVAGALIAKHAPMAVFAGATTNGKEFAGSLAARLDTGVAADCTEIDWAGDHLVARRPVYGGRLLEVVEPAGSGTWVVSVRPRAYADPGPGSGAAPAVSMEAADIPPEALDTEILSFTPEEGESVNLSEADVIVAGGRGLQEAANFEMLRDLADVLGGAVGASRAVVDAGWIAYPHQVGQTGKTVRPKLYVAVGISGAIQHLAGMKTSETIVAINKDAAAPIFKLSTWGLVGDALQIVPLLTKKIRERNGAGSPA